MRKCTVKRRESPDGSWQTIVTNGFVVADGGTFVKVLSPKDNVEEWFAKDGRCIKCEVH